MTIIEERAAVIAEALSWVGTPFRHAMRTKGLGVDCAQLLAAAFSEYAVVEIHEYPAQWFLNENAERLLTAIAEWCVPVLDGPELGDIALFRFGRTVSHSAIVVELDPLRIVHAYRPGRGVQVNEIGPGSGLSTRLEGYWRLSRWAEA